MIQITITIPDEVEEDDLEYLLGEIRYRIKYTDGVGEYDLSCVVE